MKLYCSGKRAYDKRGAVTAMNLRYKEDHVKLRMYECGDHWHLTKQLRKMTNNFYDWKRNVRRKVQR